MAEEEEGVEEVEAEAAEAAVAVDVDVEVAAVVVDVEVEVDGGVAGVLASSDFIFLSNFPTF